MEVGCLWEMGKVAEVGEDLGLYKGGENSQSGNQRSRSPSLCYLATSSCCPACSAVTDSQEPGVGRQWSPCPCSASARVFSHNSREGD